MRESGFRWLYILFFFSGFPALLYQIVWQRTLFAVYGVNIESVTIVVSAFMLGLGLGSLLGGRISKNPTAPLLLLFAGVEIGIAIYGAASLQIFHWVAASTAGAPPLYAGLLSFGLVLVPTVLMGATLPLLVAQLVKLSGNVGQSVGMLYFANTLGSAAACFVAALVTMRYLGMSGSVYVAVALNLAVALSVLTLHFRWSGIGEEQTVVAADAAPAAPALPFAAAMALSAVAGFVSLCYEIVWYRLYSFASGALAEGFAFVLGAFLFGIALGSLLTRRICRGAASDLRRFATTIGMLVLLANLLGFAIVPLVANLVMKVSYLWTLPLIAIAAGLLGATFPLMCHISVRADEKAGAGLSYLYISNIIGSAAGSWLVGFILMDYFTLREISVMLAFLGVAVAWTLFTRGEQSAKTRAITAVSAVAILAVIFLSSKPLFADVYGKMQFKEEWGEPGTKIATQLENRSGVITVDEEQIIYGGGIIDGYMTTNVKEVETDMRPLSLSFLHPNPKEILIIGMSGGAWTQIIANHPHVEKVTVVEINPGYVEVIKQYPDVAPLLSNAKVELIIDDGRRWMLQNSGRKFDVVIMNTIFHWRGHSTNLLSADFFNLTRKSLKPGGILFYNSTFSLTSQRTGAMTFPYGIRFGPLLALSDTPLQLDRDRWRKVLLEYQLEGKLIFDPDSAEDMALVETILKKADGLSSDHYVGNGMETRENVLRRTAGRPIITDDNMATEWRGRTTN